MRCCSSFKRSCACADPPRIKRAIIASGDSARYQTTGIPGERKVKDCTDHPGAIISSHQVRARSPVTIIGPFLPQLVKLGIRVTSAPRMKLV
jgi:hypothetical protein